MTEPQRDRANPAAAMSVRDYMADYNAAQSAGHHEDCDGYRTAHRVVAVDSTNGGYTAACVDGCAIAGGWYRTRSEAERAYTLHAREVPCDGRCKDWN